MTIQRKRFTRGILVMGILISIFSCKKKSERLNFKEKEIKSITFEREKPSLLIEKDSNIVEYGFDTIVRSTKTGIDTIIRLNLKDSVVVTKETSKELSP